MTYTLQQAVDAARKAIDENQHALMKKGDKQPGEEPRSRSYAVAYGNRDAMRILDAELAKVLG